MCTNSNAALVFLVRDEEEASEEEEEVWGRVEAVRALHQKNYGTWPAHISVVWPFVWDDAMARCEDEVRALCSEYEPMRISLAAVEESGGEVAADDRSGRKGRTKAKKVKECQNLYAVIHPSGEDAPRLHELTGRVQRVFGVAAQSDAHLTVGQCTRQQIQEVAAGWQSGHITVRALYVITRRSQRDTFSVRARYPLGDHHY
eukprot:TRINITY_DN3622_c0_g1_i1.p1 TRINITY_DN3622_c0_g1~~TRINITY_DN3622_c0_g1_i1.p1  ORF type:complete len:202 (+),score=80.07 TRINITY_DN3622_c0_g1_i1:130-735(+)